MSEVKVNKISPRTNCGTITLGDSGDTITIPSGVTITNNGTQTGFGRTGTVNWDTTKKTASFTAVSGNGYFIDTSSSAITVTLPASPSAGDIVSVKDYANSFATNALTIGRNSSNINGDSDFDPVFETDGTFLTFIYVDATQGWKITDESTNDTNLTNTFITATGGTVTTVCTNFKVHTFTGPGTFCVSAGSGPVAVVDYLVVAGGGAGANAENGVNGHGGGGGAGGYRESGGTSSGCYTVSPLGSSPSSVAGIPVTVQAYPITVGSGGAGSNTDDSPGFGNQGSNSIFSTITSAGGGGGARGVAPPGGGSGGGAACGSVAGAGNTPPVSPPQGNPGGSTGGSGPGMTAGGGGGATAAGSDGSPGGPAGGGGAGATSCITASPVTRAGGGGGGGNSGETGGGPGGPGGGGAGGNFPLGNGTNGTANTGGGGGATASGPGNATSGSGGSGIVILRYKFQ